MQTTGHVPTNNKKRNILRDSLEEHITKVTRQYVRIKKRNHTATVHYGVFKEIRLLFQPSTSRIYVMLTPFHKNLRDTYTLCHQATRDSFLLTFYVASLFQAYACKNDISFPFNNQLRTWNAKTLILIYAEEKCCKITKINHFNIWKSFPHFYLLWVDSNS